MHGIKAGISHRSTRAVLMTHRFDGSPPRRIGATLTPVTTYQQGQFNGLGQTVTLSGNPVFGNSCVLATGASCQFWGGIIFAGTGATGVRYQSNDAAIVQTGGGGANFFPGNASGTISQGFYS
jgi:hypothetical protein